MSRDVFLGDSDYRVYYCIGVGTLHFSFLRHFAEQKELLDVTCDQVLNQYWWKSNHNVL